MLLFLFPKFFCFVFKGVSFSFDDCSERMDARGGQAGERERS